MFQKKPVSASGHGAEKKGSTHTGKSENEAFQTQQPKHPQASAYRPTSMVNPLRKTASTSPGDGNGLHVGTDIHLKGEITSCDSLYVEGKVEASMHSRDINIAPEGIFIGTVEIDRAEISGRFEGEMIVREKLTLRRTGKISGSCRYGEIEIEPGGQISGTVKPLTHETDISKPQTTDLSGPPGPGQTQ